MQILACVLSSLFGRTRRGGLAVGSRPRTGSLTASSDSLPVGATTSAVRLKEEPGDTNVSNALTKPLDERRMTNLLTAVGYDFRGGRTSLAPAAQ